MHSGFGALREQCSMSCGIRVQLHAVTPALRADLERLGQLWRDGLGRWGGPWLAGAEFCAVDAFFAPVAFRIQTYGLALPEDAAAYARRLLELPGMRHWYAAALQETWRDPEHEADVPRWGVITADLRSAGPAPG
jgi:glutathione S-transferase